MTTRYVICRENTGYEVSLTPGQVYEILPDPAEANRMIRVVDDSGEDYLFEADSFEPVRMSALLREWIDEHLDLPVIA